MLSVTLDGVPQVMAYVKKTDQEIPISGIAAPDKNGKTIHHPTVPIQESHSGENNL